MTIQNRTAVTGYHTLSESDIALMNEGKALGVKLGEYIDKLHTMQDIDKRWLATGKTDMQKGLMAVIRSIAQPSTF